jgi:hypothetical protein
MAQMKVDRGAANGMTIAMLGAGIEAASIYNRARELGCRIVAIDMDPNAFCVQEADVFVKASCYDADEIIRELYYKQLIDGLEVDGVMCAATDAADVQCQVALSLSCKAAVPEELAILSVDKMGLYSTLSGLQKAGYVSFLSPPKKHGNFYIYTANKSRGAKNVQILRSIIVSEEIKGKQFSVEGVVGSPLIGVAMRNYDKTFGTHPVEDGCIGPVINSDLYLINKLAFDEVADVFGVEEGAALKLDTIYDGENIYVLEIAPRLSGGYLASDIFDAVFPGMDIVGHAIMHALDMDHDVSGNVSWNGKWFSQRYGFPKNGTIVRGPEPSVCYDEMPMPSTNSAVGVMEVKYKKVGDKFDGVKSHGDRLGSVIVVANNVIEADMAARAGAEYLEGTYEFE